MDRRATVPSTSTAKGRKRGRPALKNKSDGQEEPAQGKKKDVKNKSDGQDGPAQSKKKDGNVLKQKQKAAKKLSDVEAFSGNELFKLPGTDSSGASKKPDPPAGTASHGASKNPSSTISGAGKKPDPPAAACTETSSSEYPGAGYSQGNKQIQDPPSNTGYNGQSPLNFSMRGMHQGIPFSQTGAPYSQTGASFSPAAHFSNPSAASPPSTPNTRVYPYPQGYQNFSPTMNSGFNMQGFQNFPSNTPSPSYPLNMSYTAQLQDMSDVVVPCPQPITLQGFEPQPKQHRDHSQRHRLARDIPHLAGVSPRLAGNILRQASN